MPDEKAYCQWKDCPNKVQEFPVGKMFIYLRITHEFKFCSKQCADSFEKQDKEDYPNPLFDGIKFYKKSFLSSYVKKKLAVQLP